MEEKKASPEPSKSQGYGEKMKKIKEKRQLRPAPKR